MNSTEIGLRLVAGVLLILANGFFVAIEFALTRARQFSESEFVDGDSRLERAWAMTQDLELYLTTCQVGITASSIAVGIVAEPALAALFEPLFAGTTLATVGAGAIIAYGIINLVHLTHGEQAPTYLGVERSRLVCRYGAAPLYWFYLIISPLISLGDSVAKWTLQLFGIEMTGAWLEAEEDAIESRAQLRSRLSSLLERGELSGERHDEVLGALKAGTTEVREVMVPKSDIVALSTDASVAENLDRVTETPHTRYPLVGSNLETVEGIVYVPSVVARIEELKGGETAFSDIAAPPMTVSADTSVSDAIDRFQAERQELAVVFEDGDVVGLLTATDALETVMGELEDPLDADFRAERTPA
ncbi:cbs domain-containing protein [Halogeometricum borinquense DSM 11551]|uniref:CBS domain-containing protein n=2 Tax=Halogeometricum borinquense TaxID=60847 RepID=E4NTQ1_HALBP|nr:hemolysin family protein [Halogeometricum borinquense]ADQ67103.1 CBS domain-containing protein [Halogeometricum borinquense DSM 11551]ELY29649.1 cbs domain-containing protein [Halogeometricum borinquense DSM 11551]RYJ13933.1 HlyC/CorC family transporter [Halogeometricum borinquense]